MEEIWKDIPGYEGYYQASNLGRIKSLLFQNNLYNKKYRREKILKPRKSKDGCLRVELWKEGQHKTWLTYRLVAMTFLGIPKDKNITLIKDGEEYQFNSLSEASKWMGKYKGYLSEKIKKGVFGNEYYRWRA